MNWLFLIQILNYLNQYKLFYKKVQLNQQLTPPKNFKKTRFYK